ncbi:MAG: hypothetical protein M1827_003489 [Pycnora praestabilis]|nr:MAG: hypothetical protein M1827_003489 [Pycnora praestabilis]
MAGQKTPRPAKRHLVRWSDEMDKKLLLSIQSVCNTDGIKLPWGKIAKGVEPQITDGAVIQHLAKLRTRMVQQGIQVPPPLRRGGAQAISGATNGYIGGSYASSSATTKPSSTARGRGKASYAASTEQDDDDDDEQVDIDRASPEDDYGYSMAKRVKHGSRAKEITFTLSGKRKAMGKAIKEEDCEDSDYASATKVEDGSQGPPSKKQKRRTAPKTLGKGRYSTGVRGDNSPTKTRARRSSVDYRQLAGFGTDTTNHSSSSSNKKEEKMLGAGKDYLKLADSEDDEDEEEHISRKKGKSSALSKIVILKVNPKKLKDLALVESVRDEDDEGSSERAKDESVRWSDQETAEDRQPQSDYSRDDRINDGNGAGQSLAVFGSGTGYAQAELSGLAHPHLFDQTNSGLVGMDIDDWMLNGPVYEMMSNVPGYHGYHVGTSGSFRAFQDSPFRRSGGNSIVIPHSPEPSTFQSNTPSNQVIQQSIAPVADNGLPSGTTTYTGSTPTTNTSSLDHPPRGRYDGVTRSSSTFDHQMNFTDAMMGAEDPLLPTHDTIPFDINDFLNIDTTPVPE